MEHLDEVAAELVTHEIINHSDKVQEVFEILSRLREITPLANFQDVKLYAACCLVDILRLYAPQAPYTQVELKVKLKVVTRK